MASTGTSSHAAPSRWKTMLRVLWIGALVVPWTAFTAWMFVYGMVFSALHGLFGVWALWPRESRTAGVRAGTVAVFAAALLTVPLAGLPEYAATTERLHCRTLGFTGAEVPKECRAEDVAKGNRIAREGGPLFTTRERLGVHGFNHVLAVGGWLVGLPEVAHETVLMSWKVDPLGSATEQPTAVRRRQCEASYERGADAALASAERWESDMPMRSGLVRRQIAAGIHRLGSDPGARVSLRESHWSSGGKNDFGGYAWAMAYDSFRSAITLEVGDSAITLERLPDGAIAATWTGIIHYPGTDVSFPMPYPSFDGFRLHSDVKTLRVSETIFCGMSIDGAMNPFHLTYAWTLRADDPRLTPEGVEQSERGWFEQSVAAVVRRRCTAPADSDPSKPVKLTCM